MQAKAIRNRFLGCPASVAGFGSPESDTDISIGKEYEVHALSVFNCVVFFQIVNDIDIIVWLPAWFFSLSDPTVPSDWVCCSTGGDLQLVLGASFVAADEESYGKMVELNPESVAAFWRRFEAITNTRQ